MKYFKLTFLFLAIGIVPSFAQGTSQKYSDADFHLLNKNYPLALPLYEELQAANPTNANLSYKVGVCLLAAEKNKNKAIPFLEEAVKNINRNYEEYSQFEKKAPPEALYELGRAYHFDYRFDDAIKEFELYKAELKEKGTERIKDVDRQIEMCNNGKELIKTPQNISIVNLGDSVNSEYPDFAPVISADEATLIFTSRRAGGTTDDKTLDDNQFYEDIYISTKNKDGEWGTAKPIGSNINSAGHEASIGLSADGQQLFIYKSTFEKGDKGDGNIYKSDLNGDVWTVPEKLGSDINTDKSWETSACLTADGQTLYFVSDREGGYGGRDIYKCVKLPNGEWSKSQNLGAPINTEYDEDGPFIHPDGKQLYFASKGHKSIGGFDIFFSLKEESDSGTKWTEPQNIGFPISTTDDDVFFVTSADGKRAYYSSFQEGGFGEKDIYQLSLNDQTQKDVAVLRGFIKMYDGSNLPFDTKVSVFDADTKEQITMETKPNTKSGKYLIVLPTNKRYTLVYETPGCDKVTREVALNSSMSLSKIDGAFLLDTVVLCKGGPKAALAETDPKKQPGYHNKDASGKDIPEPPALLSPLNLQIFFIYNYNQIPEQDPKYVEFINNLITEIQKGKSLKISVEASASFVPTAKFKTNENLSSTRADLGKKSIYKTLKNKGIDVSKVKIIKSDYLIQGPSYKNDYDTNRLEYEKWQYIKISVK